MSSTAARLLQITVNGQVWPAALPMSVQDLIASLQLDARQIAIERNMQIVPRSAYATTAIQPGDAVEIVGFIGGG